MSGDMSVVVVFERNERACNVKKEDEEGEEGLIRAR